MSDLLKSTAAIEDTIVTASSHRIVVLPGDGIGREVMAEGIGALRAVEKRLRGVSFELSERPAGAAESLRQGNPLPESSFAACEQADVILLGAMGLPSVRWADGSLCAGLLIDRIYQRGNWQLSRRLPAMMGFALAAVGLLMSLRMETAPGNTPKPILFNEDDHFHFDAPTNNFTAAIDEYAGRRFFDFRMKNESFADGYQSIPGDWTISSPRKSGFFRLLAEITGHTPRNRRSPSSPDTP